MLSPDLATGRQERTLLLQGGRSIVQIRKIAANDK